MPKRYTPCSAITRSDVVILPLNISTVVSYVPGFLRTRTVLRVDERLIHILNFTTFDVRDLSRKVVFIPGINALGFQLTFV